MPMNKTFVYKVVLPFGFASALCAIFYSTQHDKFPKDASAHEWGNFLRRVLADVEHTERVKIMALVLLAHFAHTILCVPCVHLTQMLCGYCLGFVGATVLCAACECFVITAYILLHAARNTFVEADFEEFVAYLRQRGLIFPFIILSLMSSMPINSTSCIIGFGDVTAREFLCTHYVVSTINSFKCCFLGHQIRFATNDATIAALGYVIFIISVFPTLITIGLWYFTFVVFRKRNSALSARQKIDSENCNDDPEFDVRLKRDATFYLRLEQFFAQCPMLAPSKYNVLQSPLVVNDAISFTPIPSPRDGECPVQETEDNNLSETLVYVVHKVSPGESPEAPHTVLARIGCSQDNGIIDDLSTTMDDSLHGPIPKQRVPHESDTLPQA